MKRNERNNSDSSSSEEVGPTLPQNTSKTSSGSTTQLKPKKRLQKIKNLKGLLNALPDSPMYEKSYMHRAKMTHVHVTRTGFIVTAAEDGSVKFWKKEPVGIESKFHVQSHLSLYFCILLSNVLGKIVKLCSSVDGSLLASVGEDRSLKIYDVVSYGMFVLFCCCGLRLGSLFVGDKRFSCCLVLV